MTKVKWQKQETSQHQLDRWELKIRNQWIAMVWGNGFWLTRSVDGTEGMSGECKNPDTAMLQAAGAALLQGFIED